MKEASCLSSLILFDDFFETNLSEKSHYFQKCFGTLA